MAGEHPPHAIRACAACKEKKLRCLMNDGPPWDCQRCVQQKQNCVFPESRPRQRRKKVHELRIEQLERNIEMVMSLLPSPCHSSILSTRADSEAPRGSEAFGASPEQSLADVIAQDIVSIQQSELLVADYRDQFAKNFPYVVLPEGATLLSLRRTSPMLLLAILVTTCWKDRTQQDALNQVFLKTLSAKLILQGDRDLDLLKGLMVYLNWVHLHIAPKTQQVYRLMSITASMAVDYGITRRPGKGRHQQLNVESVSEVPKGLTAVDEEFWDPEAKRAYLGCYHIATWYSIMTRKLSPLVYNDYLHACARTLATAKKAPSDADLIFHLEITGEAEKVYTLFNYTETHQPQYMSDEQMQIYLNAFSVKVQDWRSRLPASLTEDPCQQMWPWLFEAFVREVGLSGLSRSTDLSIFRIRVIVDTLVSTRNYFDTFLTIPPNRIPSLPATHWALLGYSILLAATMSLSIQTPGWNIEAARSIIKLDTYLDAISVRVRDLSSRMYPSETLKDWYGSLLASWEAIKSRYLAALQQEQSGTETQTQTPDSQLAPSQETAQRMDNGPRIPSSALPRTDPRQPHMTDNSFRPNGGFELFGFAANAGSWMVPDFDVSWDGVADF